MTEARHAMITETCAHLHATPRGNQIARELNLFLRGAYSDADGNERSNVEILIRAFDCGWPRHVLDCLTAPNSGTEMKGLPESIRAGKHNENGTLR